jgi:hypothetical protein
MFTFPPAPNYSTIESFESWHIPHNVYNTTWRETNNVTFPFQGKVSDIIRLAPGHNVLVGNALLFYGGSFSWYQSINYFWFNNETAAEVSLNSALPWYQMVGGPNFIGNMYTSGLIFAQANLSNNESFNVFVDSNSDDGTFNLHLDYIEVISVTGGSP